MKAQRASGKNGGEKAQLLGDNNEASPSNSISYQVEEGYGTRPRAQYQNASDTDIEVRERPGRCADICCIMPCHIIAESCKDSISAGLLAIVCCPAITLFGWGCNLVIEDAMENLERDPTIMDRMTENFSSSLDRLRNSNSATNESNGQ